MDTHDEVNENKNDEKAEIQKSSFTSPEDISNQVEVDAQKNMTEAPEKIAVVVGHARNWDPKQIFSVKRHARDILYSA